MKFFQCKHCKAIVSLASVSKELATCCSETMVELIPNTTDGAREKHVPVIEINGNNITVTVGETEHPMQDAHFIEWIAIETKQGEQRKYLKPGNKPQAHFVLTDDDTVIAAYCYCNLHGLWLKK